MTQPDPCAQFAFATRPLQGTWQGLEVGQNYRRQIASRFTGDVLRYESPTNEWHEGTIALLAATNPPATVLHDDRQFDPGSQVRAIFKFEEGKLTLLIWAGTEADQGAPPIDFAGKKSMRSKLRKARP